MSRARLVGMDDVLRSELEACRAMGEGSEPDVGTRVFDTQAIAAFVDDEAPTLRRLPDELRDVGDHG
jgi:hypothetical protein